MYGNSRRLPKYGKGGRRLLPDLVDVRALEAAGYRIGDSWRAAEAKDRGLTPAQLAWVLSQIEMGDDVALPAGVSAADLRQYLADLIKRLTSAAFPSRN
jgi:aryl-alcohol dehydrogenase-like predicted oxidoreductase